MKRSVIILLFALMTCPIAPALAAPDKPGAKPVPPHRAESRPAIPVPPGKMSDQERQKLKDAAAKKDRLLRQIEEIKESCEKEQGRMQQLSEATRGNLEQALKASRTLVEHIAPMAAALEKNDIPWDSDLWLQKRDLELAVDEKWTDYWYQNEVDDLQRTKDNIDNPAVRAAADNVLNLIAEGHAARKKILEMNLGLSRIEKRLQAGREKLQQANRDAQLRKQLTDALIQIAKGPQTTPP